MSLGGSCPVAGPSHLPPAGRPLPTGHPSREREDDALRAAALLRDGSIFDLTTIAGPPASESRVAEARAAHPSTSGAGSPPGERHLAVAKPIRPPAGPEAWSAGLWGSFA